MLAVPFLLLKGLKDYTDIFSVKDTSVLLLNRPFDYTIKTEGKDPLYKPLYNFFKEELKVFQDYLDDSVIKGWI